MSDPRFNLPDLNAAQMGAVAGLTERQVKDRVAKGQFICHYTGGTPEHPRGMRFTPEQVEYNRNVNTGRPAMVPQQPTHSDAQIRKGVARLRRTQQAVSS
jgi:hypothetical protein